MDWEKAKYQYEIPFWIYCTPLYKEKHPNIYKDIVHAKKRQFMTDALPHLLIHLAGISTKWYSEQFDILSPRYNNQRKRLLEENVDYNLLRTKNTK